MSSNETAERRSRGRVDLDAPVRVRYQRFQDFIQEMAANISTGGMFIASDEPRPPGVEFDFELVLEDGLSLVKGRAEVVWVREETLGIGRSAGMGVRFIELDRASKILIAKIVAKLRGKGRRPFDLEAQAPTEGVEHLPAAPDEHPNLVEQQAERATARRWSRGFRFTILALTAAVAGVLVVWLFHELYVRPRIEALEVRVEELASAGVGGRTLRAAQADSGEVEALEAIGAGAEHSEPMDVVKAWARAWSEQRVDDYLGFYAAEFMPTGGASRQDWENLRRARIERQSGIQVQVLLAEEAVLESGERVITFVQAYRSTTYQDRVRKRLRLVPDGGSWKIAEERVLRATAE